MSDLLDPRERMWWDLAIQTCTATKTEWYEIFPGTLVAVDAELKRLEAENVALRSEILTLQARLGNIADLTTMPLPEGWTKRET